MMSSSFRVPNRSHIGAVEPAVTAARIIERIGVTPVPVAIINEGGASLAARVKKIRGDDAIRVVGDPNAKVSRIATGAGTGGTGTYTVSQTFGTYSSSKKKWSGTIPSEPMTASTAITNPDCPLVVPNATPALLDYAPIPGAYVELSSTGSSAVQLANEGAMARPTGLTTGGVTSGNVFIYNLKITTDGLLSLSYSVNGGAYSPVINNQSISNTNGPLPSKLRFGFAGSTGGDTNIHELLCFKAAPADSSSSSATTDQQLTNKVETSSQAYFAYYSPSDWTGRMTAYGLVVSSTGALSINSLATWDSECVLTGVSNLSTSTCPTTGLTTPVNGQPSATGSAGSRVMLTWNGLDTAGNPGTAGIPFEWPGSTGITTAASR